MIGEFFILGEDWSLYEELVPRENFSEDEIAAKHSRRYYSADGRSIYSCPTGIATRAISLPQLAAHFTPLLSLTYRVQTCEFVNPPDVYVNDSFALIPPHDSAKVKPALYGDHKNGVVTALYGAGVRPLSEFAELIAQPLAEFCRQHRLILLLHSEYPLDVSNAAELMKEENTEIG